jgi:hypothetical protein
VTSASITGPLSRRNVHLVIYAALLSVAVIAVPILSYVGVRTLLDSRDGEVIDPILDPALPGYQALVSPSPTLAVLHTSDDGSLVGVAVLALSGEDVDGGSVLLVPPATIAAVPEFGDLTLEYVQSLNGTDTTFSLIEWILGLGIDDVVVLGHGTWAELVEPLGGLTLTNPDDLTGPDGAVRFPAGTLALAPDEVGPFLETLEAGENPLNRLLRQELVWSAWLKALADDPDAGRFGGEQDRGLARFVPTISAGQRRIVQLPVTAPPTEPGAADPVVFVPDDEAIAELIPQVVPFPAGARPGDRPLVRVLDGSGRQAVIAPAVRQVAVGGGQVVMIGNADAFGVAETQLLVADEALVPFARSVAEALGVGSVQVVDYIDENAELIVVLGDDYAP